MNKKMIAAGLMAAASIGTATAVEVTANIGVSSAYVFRGTPFGDDAAISGGVDMSAGAFYAGTWISSQGGIAGGGGEELDLYAGAAFEVGDIGLDFGYIYYAFPSEETGGGNNVSEIYAGVSFPFGLDTYLWVAPSGVDGVPDDEYLYLDVNYSMGITSNTSFYAHFGLYQGFGDANDDDAGTAELSTADYAVGFTVDDFFIQVSYLDDYQVNNDEEPQYIVGWSKEFTVKK